MRSFIRTSVIVALLLGLLYAVGPSADFASPETGLAPVDSSWVQMPLGNIESALKAREQAGGVPRQTAACIVWADSVRRSRWVIVYLPGFGASHGEGDPIHREMARRYGVNLVLGRMEGHGFPDDTSSFENLDPASWLASAADCLALGRRLGDSVLVMATSTGATLGLTLAALRPERVHALVCYSPNIAVANPYASLLTGPWGLPLARMLHGGKYRDWSDQANDSIFQYWTTRYRLEGVVAMQSLVEHTMKPETFAGIRQPIFFGLWYGDEENCDATISVTAARKAFDQLATADAQKRLAEWSTVKAHALASRHFSQDLDTVRKDTRNFLEGVLGWQPVALPLVNRALD
jgi:pimeloyl-ACP methyl ester carboxylesterase